MRDSTRWARSDSLLDHLSLSITESTSQRLDKLDKSFAGLESTAAALQATHSADAEAQLRLHSQVQIEMQVAQGLLADITASAASLQDTVHDTSSKVAHMVALGGVTNKVLNWGWSLVVLLVVYHFHPKVAGYAAAIIGKTATASLHKQNIH